MASETLEFLVHNCHGLWHPFCCLKVFCMGTNYMEKSGQFNSSKWLHQTNIHIVFEQRESDEKKFHLWKNYSLVVVFCCCFFG